MGALQRPSPGGVTWTIAGERLAVLAWPRAVLLQMAHPLVAAGVAQHSGFRASTFAPFSRLHATIDAMRQLAFGSDDAAAAVVRRIRSIHDRVNGTVREGAGIHPSGTRYSAHDPALLLWVHATLVDSHVRILEPMLRPFTLDERDRYCREAAPFAEVLGATAADVPRTWHRAAGVSRRPDPERVRLRRRRRAHARPGHPAADHQPLRVAPRIDRRARDRRLAAGRDPGRLRVHLERDARAAAAARAVDPAGAARRHAGSVARWPEARRAAATRSV